MDDSDPRLTPSEVQRVPLLDRGTLNDESPGKGLGRDGSLARFQVVAFPTAGEASIRLIGGGSAELPPRPEDHVARSVRRSRSTLRRFCVHNGLGYMPTLTFRHDPASRSAVCVAVGRFLRRLRYRGVDEPFSWVIERGEKDGRLHVHFACNWWGRVEAVEVCERCATPGLRRVRSDIPPSSSFCVGCIWGNGFVGRPSECVGDPRGVAVYVSKYAAKELNFESPGLNRYHVPRGYQPPEVRYGSFRFEQASRRLSEYFDPMTLEVTALHELLEDEWKGPPLWSFRWDPLRGGEQDRV